MLLIISILMSFQPTLSELVDVRIKYELASQSEQAAIELKSFLQPRISESAQFAGYAAALQIMMAKYYFNPLSKYDAFQKGKTQLDLLIVKYPKEIELYYLRFSIQCNTPEFLGYNTSIYSDKKFMLNNIANLKDRDLQKRIVAFLISSNKLTPDEIKQLKAHA